jgi:hypothetical protein
MRTRIRIQEQEIDQVYKKIDFQPIRKAVVRGASKIKLKKVNKKRTVTVRRVIIFLNISRHPLLICLQCCLHQYKTLKAVTPPNDELQKATVEVEKLKTIQALKETGFC